MTWLYLGMAVEAMALAALTRAPAYVLQALVFVAAAMWMTWARARLGPRGAPGFASRLVGGV
ncbi:MAG: hypothetical protein LH650_05830, partial [Chloroflexi bacterium]|nr:hypothetical protein [Chloroflexota bacterium]